MAVRPYVAVVGPGDATSQETRAAEAIGRGLADAGAIVVCGGLGGVMEAACHEEEHDLPVLKRIRDMERAKQGNAPSSGR